MRNDKISLAKVKNTLLAMGALLMASTGVQAAPAAEPDRAIGPGGVLASTYMECNDGTRFYLNPPHVILHPSLCDNHGGVKAGGGIGGGKNPPRPPVDHSHERLRTGGPDDDGRIEAQDYNSTRSNRRKN